MKKLAITKLLTLFAFGVLLTSCSADEIQSENLKLDQAQPEAEFHQKDVDSVTPNENEPIIVKPPRD